MFEILFLGRLSSIIVAGGFGSSSVDLLTGDLGIISLPNLPQSIPGSSMVVQNGTVLLCGGWSNTDKCLQMNHDALKDHSKLNKERAWHSAVTTPTATFIFGGHYSSKTYEYLPKNSTKWLNGKTEIPRGFESGYAISVKSDQEIWLIGGTRTEKRILSFNVNHHTFQVLPFQLNVGRWGHRSAFIPNTNKIMITGGYCDGYLDSTEILDIEDGKVTMASPMNSKRDIHGMGVVTIDGNDRLAVFGGNEGRNEVDSVELFNPQTKKWENSNLKLNKANSGSSFLTVKLGDTIMSNFQI